MSDIKAVTKDSTEVRESVSTASSMMQAVDDMVIDSNEMCEIANDMLSEIRRAEKEIEARRSSVLDPMNAAIKAARALFAPAVESIDRAKHVLSGKILAYRQELERQRREEEAKAEAERRRAAEEARAAEEKARKEAEEARAKAAAMEAELAARAESAKTEEDVLALQQIEAERERLARQAEQAQLDAEAGALAAATAEITTTAPVTATAPPKGGHAVRTTWSAEVENMLLFAEFAAKAMRDTGDSTFIDMLDVSKTKINQIARATSGSMKIPGVKFTKSQTLSARA